MENLIRLNQVKSKRKKRTRYNIRKNNKQLSKRIFLNISNKHQYAQIIDEETGKTVLSVGSMNKSYGIVKNNKESSVKIAELVVTKMKEKKIPLDEGFIFDRGSRIYHGRIVAFSEKLRELGVRI